MLAVLMTIAQEAAAESDGLPRWVVWAGFISFLIGLLVYLGFGIHWAIQKNAAAKAAEAAAVTDDAAASDDD